MARRSVDIVLKGHDQATGAFNGVERASRGLYATLSRFRGLMAFAGLTGGLYGLQRVMRQSLELYMTQEDAEASLAAAMQKRGAYSRKAMEESKRFASEMQSLTTHGDEAVLQVMALGASLGDLAGKDLQDATKAAIGLQAQLQGRISLEGAMQLLSRAAKGASVDFSRYGIVLDKNASQQEQFQQVLRQGIDSFALAEAAADTTRGRLTQLGNAWGDVKERIGEGMMPAIVMLTDYMRNNMDSVEAFGMRLAEGLKSATEWALAFYTAAEVVTERIRPKHNAELLFGLGGVALLNELRAGRALPGEIHDRLRLRIENLHGLHRQARQIGAGGAGVLGAENGMGFGGGAAPWRRWSVPWEFESATLRHAPGVGRGVEPVVDELKKLHGDVNRKMDMVNEDLRIVKDHAGRIVEVVQGVAEEMDE